MRTKSRLSIRIKTNRTLVIHSNSQVIRTWCSDCERVVDMATPETAARVMETSPDALDRLVESGRLHHSDTPDGKSLICLESGSQTTPEPCIEVATVDRDGFDSDTTGQTDSAKFDHTVSESENGRPGNLNDLFDWLGDNRELAGIRYEEIRRALIKIFVCRGTHVSEDLADQTIDRVVRKLPQIRENYQGRPIDYFCGVAKKIYLEYSRKNIRPAVIAPLPVQIDEEEYNRLERCLNKLTDGDRILILEYYGGERREKIEGRKQIADSLGIPINALRIRAHRIRTHLMEMMLADAGNR